MLIKTGGVSIIHKRRPNCSINGQLLVLIKVSH